MRVKRGAEMKINQREIFQIAEKIHKIYSEHGKSDKKETVRTLLKEYFKKMKDEEQKHTFL